MNLRRNQPVRQALAGMAGGFLHCSVWSAFLALPAFPALAAVTGETSAQTDFHKRVEPLLAQYCSDCHEDGARKGSVDFDDVVSKGGATARRP